VPRVRISVEAEQDIDRIAAYTLLEWGSRQADRYLAKLESGFDLLARNPSIGRPCDSIRKDLRRFEIGRHVVFYTLQFGGILVVRVLHEHMLPAKYV
jgi:toxin ParE1/3/4